MKHLFDTQLLLHALIWPERLTRAAAALLADTRDEAMFSVVSLWEVAIKAALRRPDFDVDPADFLRALRNTGFAELSVRSEHALAVTGLPAVHGDPFDRLLIAQAVAEDVVFLTSDRMLEGYGAPVRLV